MILANQSLTLSEFLRLTDIEESPAWELLDGRPYQKPMPTLHHSRLQKRIVAAIDASGTSYEAFPELRCVLRQNSVVPGVAVVHRDRLPLGNAPMTGAPDWAIEILSPDQSTTKVIAKLQNCLAEGTQLGWLIDLTEQVVMVFWRDRPLVLLTEQAVLPVLADISLTVTAEQLFSWAER